MKTTQSREYPSILLPTLPAYLLKEVAGFMAAWFFISIVSCWGVCLATTGAGLLILCVSYIVFFAFGHRLDITLDDAYNICIRFDKSPFHQFLDIHHVMLGVGIIGIIIAFCYTVQAHGYLKPKGSLEIARKDSVDDFKDEGLEY